MMLSTVFLLTLGSALYSGAAEAHGGTEARLSQKLDTLAGSLKDMLLQEQSQQWAIFKHNLDAWNAQLKGVERKLTLSMRAQEEQQHKLTRLEQKLNHVLSKVIFLSDADVHAPARASKVDQVDQLNNVLRHLEHLEATPLLDPSSSSVQLRKLEQKLNILLLSLQPKDVRQMQALIRKQAKTLELMQAQLKQVAAQQQKGRKSWHEMLDYCQSVSGELTTFTESSDLLLKRIELVVKDVHGELNETEEQQPVDSQCATTAVAEEKEEELVEEVEVDYVQPAKADCFELRTPRIDGVYKFLVPELNELQRDFNERFCAFATEGPAWTVVQSRGAFSSQENFNRSWDDYRAGFGSFAKDFWFGNEFIHKIVYRDDYILRIELEDQTGVQVWAEYGLFRLDSESYNYQLLIGEFNGSMPDALEYHNNMDFSAYDRQNDRSGGLACAVSEGSGWWFNSCMEANLNGIYLDTPSTGQHRFKGMIWEHWAHDLKSTRMLIRPRNFDALASEEVDDEYTTNIY